MRFAAFAIVGAIGFVVQMTALELLTVGAGCAAVPATAIAVEMAVLHNFAWHERWTWSDRRAADRSSIAARLAQFHVANGAASMLCTVGGVWILCGVLGWSPLAANVAGVGCTGVVNFLALERWIFATPRRSP